MSERIPLTSLQRPLSVQLKLVHTEFPVVRKVHVDPAGSGTTGTFIVDIGSKVPCLLRGYAHKMIRAARKRQVRH